MGSLHKCVLVSWDGEIKWLHLQWSNSNSVMTVSDGEGALKSRIAKEKRTMMTEENVRPQQHWSRSTLQQTAQAPPCDFSPWAPPHSPRNRDSRSQCCYSEVLCGHTQQRTQPGESKWLVSLEDQLRWAGKMEQQRTSRCSWRTGFRRCEYLHCPKSRPRGRVLNQPAGWELWLKEHRGSTLLSSNGPIYP